MGLPHCVHWPDYNAGSNQNLDVQDRIASGGLHIRSSLYSGYNILGYGAIWNSDNNNNNSNSNINNTNPSPTCDLNIEMTVSSERAITVYQSAWLYFKETWNLISTARRDYTEQVFLGVLQLLLSVIIPSGSPYSSTCHPVNGQWTHCRLQIHGRPLPYH